MSRLPLAPVRRGAPERALVCLLASIPLLLLADLLHRKGIWFQHPRWNSDLDRSVMEISGYLQLALAAGLLLVAAVRRRAPALAAWAATLSAALLDDALQGHERFGEWLSQRLVLPTPLGLRPVDVGELAFWAVLGVGAAALVGATYVRSSARDRRSTHVLVGILAVLACFAVGVDMAHIALMPVLNNYSDTLLIWTESAGELASTSLFLAYALRLVLMADADAPRPAGSDRPAHPGGPDWPWLDGLRQLPGRSGGGVSGVADDSRRGRTT